jgi:hypothetical protein
MANPDRSAADDEIVIALVLRCSSDPIDGTVTVADRPPERFTGWMQLIQLLSRTVDRVR